MPSSKAIGKKEPSIAWLEKLFSLEKRITIIKKKEKIRYMLFSI